MEKPATLHDWQQYLKGRFDDAPFLALATAGANGPWSNTLYFAYNDSFTIFFISEESCEHMKNIATNPRVSCALYSTVQEPREKVRGVQLVGTAQWVPPEEAEQACEVYFKETSVRRPVNQANRAQEYTKPGTLWRMAKIIPEEIWVFDEASFGGSRVRISPEVFGRSS